MARAVRLLAAVALLVSGLAAVPPAARAADPGAVTVTVDRLAPVYATDGQTLTVRGTVRVGTANSASSVRLLVGVGEPRTQKATVVRELADPTPPGIDRLLLSCPSCLPTTIPAGSTVAFTATVPLGNMLRRGSIAVYPLVVRVTGVAGGPAQTLGEADSWLPYLPGSVSAPLRVSWLWPLDPAPVLAADGSVADGDFPGALAPSGAVGRQLAASTAPAGATAFAPVTYAVEPSLLDAARATAVDGWRRRGDAAGEARPADTAASGFLTRLAAATKGRGVLALPYGDPDAAALAHNGLALDLATATTTGAGEVARVLPDADVVGGLGWAAGSAIDQTELNAYASAGTTTLVVPGAQLPPTDESPVPTPTAGTELVTSGSSVRGLVTDPDLEQLLAAAGSDGPTAAMSAQRLLAVLAAVLAEAPNDFRGSRDVVLALPRSAQPSVAWAQAVLTETASVPWLQAIPLEQTASGRTADRQPLAGYPADARAAELPAATLTGPGNSVTGVRRSITDASSMLGDAASATEATRPFELALARAESYAWRADPAGSQRLRDDTATAVGAVIGGVRLASADNVTLSGRASIPVTLDNALAYPATVSLAFAGTDRTRIAPVTQTVTVPARHKLQVRVPTRADRAGTFRASLVLRTPSGREIGSVPVRVHSRAYGALTLGITFGALAVLVLALVARAVRRLRHRRSTSPTASA